LDKHVDRYIRTCYTTAFLDIRTGRSDARSSGSGWDGMRTFSMIVSSQMEREVPMQLTSASCVPRAGFQDELRHIAPTPSNGRKGSV
jgi:hypothetical protein